MQTHERNTLERNSVLHFSFKIKNKTFEENVQHWASQDLFWDVILVSVSPSEDGRSLGFAQQSKKEMIFADFFNLCATKIDQAC